MVEARRQIGDEAEEAAVRFLEGKGYRIRNRNFHCREGEVDIVAETADTVCFVEVRSRSADLWGDPSGTVSFAKQRKVVRAALRYLFGRNVGEKMIRFDVISVVGRGPDAMLEHIPDAFDAGM
jgi:putative endonuclease